MVHVSKVDLTSLIGKEFVANTGESGRYYYDCYECVKEIFAQYDINLPEHFLIVSDDKETIDNTFKSETSAKWRKINEPIEPCLVAIRFNSPVFVNHVGVYVGDGRFIHVRLGGNVCKERIDSPSWRHRIAGYYEYIGK